MDNLYSVAFARDNLARLLHQAESGVPVKITRRGKPVAVLLGLEEYEKLKAPPRFVEAYQEWRDTWDKKIEEIELEGLRDRSDGREVHL